MTLRLIEMVVPNDSIATISELSSIKKVIQRWDDQLNENRTLVRMLVDAVETESLLDELEDRFTEVDSFRLMVLSVEATLPRPSDKDDGNPEPAAKSLERMSREEIYHDVVQGANVTRVYVAQVVIATIVAAVGLLRNDNVVIIGAMVIAPLLGPNMSLCLATTLGDLKLAIASLKANAIGLAVAFVVSLIVGFSFAVDVNIESIRARTQVSGADILLALASGCAGVLAFTSGAPSALIGVMVAVALLPPFAVFGLLVASGEYDAARGAMLLVATNVICVNLAGVLTFAAQGLRPRTWWEAERAKRSTQIAIATWCTLLAILALLIYETI